MIITVMQQLPSEIQFAYLNFDNVERITNRSKPNRTVSIKFNNGKVDRWRFVNNKGWICFRG